MKRIIFYLPALFLILANTAFAKQPTIEDIDFELNIEKTVSDAMIEDFYKHPEVISDIDKECAEVMEWVDSQYDYGMEKYYHRAILCLTWEINKQLNEEQIELLVKLKSVINNVIVDLTKKDGYTVLEMLYTGYSGTLMTVKKIYNMVYSPPLPICFEETESIYQNKHHTTCDIQPSDYLKHCLKEKDPKTCINKKITAKFLANTAQTGNTRADIYWLNKLTDKFISSLYTDKVQQNIKTMDFYDFYIKLIDDIISDVNYFIEHNV